MKAEGWILVAKKIWHSQHTQTSNISVDNLQYSSRKWFQSWAEACWHLPSKHACRERFFFFFSFPLPSHLHSWSCNIIGWHLLLDLQFCSASNLVLSYSWHQLPAIIQQHLLINGGKGGIYQEPALPAYHGWTLSPNRTRESINQLSFNKKDPRARKPERQAEIQCYHMLQVCLLILLTVTGPFKSILKSHLANVFFL